jgi:hypothetical protein
MMTDCFSAVKARRVKKHQKSDPLCVPENLNSAIMVLKAAENRS